MDQDAGRLRSGASAQTCKTDSGGALRASISVTGYAQEKEQPWKCSLRPIKRHLPAAPLKAGACTARTKPYRKRLRYGKTANVVAWRFWRPLTIPALRFSAGKAASSLRNPCGNLPLK